MCKGRLGRSLDLGVAGLRFAVADVFERATGKDDGVLWHDADTLTQIVQ